MAGREVGGLECAGQPWMFEPSADELAGLLRELYHDRDEVKRRGEAAAARAREWSWERPAAIALAWLGDFAAVLLITVRTYRLIFRPELLDSGQYQIKPVE